MVLYAGMLVLAAYLARSTGCPSLFTLPPTRTHLLVSVAVALAFSALVVLGGRLLEAVPWYRDMADVFKKMLTSPDMLGHGLDAHKAFVIALYSGIGEEAFFRGFLQPWLIATWASWLDTTGLAPATLGILSATAIFGLLHFPVVEELRPWTLFAVAVGLVLGLLAHTSGSLIAPALAHILINWLNLKRLAEWNTQPPLLP